MKLSLTLRNGVESGGFGDTRIPKRRVLVNWDNITNIRPTATAYGDDYTEIYFVGGGSLSIEETVQHIELILSANENSKKG